MDTPSQSCRKGIHIASEIEPGVVRCAWCGLVARVQSRDTDASSAVVPSPENASTSCCDSSTRQAHYPRPTITERHDEVATDFDERFRRMARQYVASSAALTQWVKAGNKLPAVYL